ncbi:PDZ domain-containing protein [Microbulbifer guangxiensis]|uniref:PDZ domain-containing protein n=1 Tax=Microbulbifer guangxiensis TaxID=2904249 RepID=UPI001F1DC090|nr:PDZ domain-containing protein [Microbulbifer guangxiensis]
MHALQQRSIPAPIILLLAAVTGFLFSLPLLPTTPVRDGATVETSAPALENRLARLENSMARAREIQENLLALIEEMHGQPVSTKSLSGAEGKVMAADGAPRESAMPTSPPTRNFSRSRRELLIEAGISRERAERILRREWELRYERQQLGHQYKHLEDQSTAEAVAVARELERYDNIPKLVGSELSPSEYERYREATTPRERMVITAVLEGSNAASAGIRPGDLLLSYNGVPVTDAPTMRSLLNESVPGSSVPVVIRRQEGDAEETVYVAAGPLGVQTAFNAVFAGRNSGGNSP